MKKNRTLWILLALVCCAALLTACSQPAETFPTEARQNQTEQQAPAEESQAAAAEIVQAPVVINYDDGSYDPTQEAGGGDEYIGDSSTPAPTMYSDYAGATPVRIDPVDKPTPTPLPKLTFAYTTYTVAGMHVTFEGPVGWLEDASAADTWTLQDVNPSMDYAATVVLHTAPLNKDYNQSELTKEVKAALDSIRSDGNFDSFETSNTATRDFIKGNGVYATYKGYKNDLNQTGVAGRVIVNSVNKTLYMLHVSYPRGLADTYADGVYNKIRHSMKLTD